MAVRKRLNLSGSATAFVTTAVYNWKPILRRGDAAFAIVEQLQETLPRFQASIIAYVIMPSHVHLLLGLREIEKLSKCIQSFKSFTSRRIRRMRLPELAENDYRLWRPRFDDLIAQSEQQLRIKIEYIHNNPVKAGLVERVEDWEYPSAVDWLTEGSGLIGIDKGFQWLRE